MTVKCCVCNLERVGGEWKRGNETRGPVSHTYCPECLQEQLEAHRSSLRGQEAKAV